MSRMRKRKGNCQACVMSAGREVIMENIPTEDFLFVLQMRNLFTKNNPQSQNPLCFLQPPPSDNAPKQASGRGSSPDKASLRDRALIIAPPPKKEEGGHVKFYPYKKGGLEKLYTVHFGYSGHLGPPLSGHYIRLAIISGLNKID